MILLRVPPPTVAQPRADGTRAAVRRPIPARNSPKRASSTATAFYAVGGNPVWLDLICFQEGFVACLRSADPHIDWSSGTGINRAINRVGPSSGSARIARAIEIGHDATPSSALRDIDRKESILSGASAVNRFKRLAFFDAGENFWDLGKPRPDDLPTTTINAVPKPRDYRHVHHHRLA